MRTGSAPVPPSTTKEQLESPMLPVILSIHKGKNKGYDLKKPPSLHRASDQSAESHRNCPTDFTGITPQKDATKYNLMQLRGGGGSKENPLRTAHTEN